MPMPSSCPSPIAGAAAMSWFPLSRAHDTFSGHDQLQKTIIRGIPQPVQKALSKSHVHACAGQSLQTPTGAHRPHSTDHMTVFI